MKRWYFWLPGGVSSFSVMQAAAWASLLCLFTRAHRSRNTASLFTLLYVMFCIYVYMHAHIVRYAPMDVPWKRDPAYRYLIMCPTTVHLGKRISFSVSAPPFRFPSHFLYSQDKGRRRRRDMHLEAVCQTEAPKPSAQHSGDPLCYICF